MLRGRGSRSSRNNITVLKRIRQLLRRDQTARVCDIGHQVRAVLVRRLPQARVIPVTRVSRGTADDEFGLEDAGLGGEFGVVDELGVGVEAVGEGLEVDGGSGHFLFGGLYGRGVVDSVETKCWERMEYVRSNRG